MSRARVSRPQPARIYHTVPWAPGLERAQVTRLVGDACYVALRTSAAAWQLGIRKGFGREVVKARLLLDGSSACRLAITLGMLEPECDRLADEMLS